MANLLENIFGTAEVAVGAVKGDYRWDGAKWVKLTPAEIMQARGYEKGSFTDLKKWLKQTPKVSIYSTSPDVLIIRWRPGIEATVRGVTPTPQDMFAEKARVMGFRMLSADEYMTNQWQIAFGLAPELQTALVASPQITGILQEEEKPSMLANLPWQPVLIAGGAMLGLSVINRPVRSAAMGAAVVGGSIAVWYLWKKMGASEE